MFDIGASELIVVGVVALIVIGPKDLPDMFRQMGRFTAKLRAMGREFSRAMEQAANESGAADAARDLKAATSSRSLGLDAVKNAADRFEKWDPIKNAAKPTVAAKAVEVPKPAVQPVPLSEMGPATKALAEKQAAKRKILAETTDKLKAVDAPTGDEPVAGKVTSRVRRTAPAAPASKPRTRKAVAKADPEVKAVKAAATRKPARKKADEA